MLEKIKESNKLKSVEADVLNKFTKDELQCSTDDVDDIDDVDVGGEKRIIGFR